MCYIDRDSFYGKRDRVNNERKGTRFCYILEYGVVLVGFLMMYFFILPQSDVFLFAQETDGSFRSVWDFSLHYGNGRLLGNLIGVYFSSHFAYAGFIVATVLTFMVFLLNYLLFNHDLYTVFPVALLIAIPSTGIVTECYHLFTGFCNYVTPMMFLELSLCCMKGLSGATGLRKLFLLSAAAICGFSLCLFSENTTILALATFFALLCGSFARLKSAFFPSLLCFISSLLGSLVMFLIPVMTQTGEKMDSYRSIASGVFGIIRQCVISFCQFADIFNHIYVVLFLFSFAMLMLCIRQDYGSTHLKNLQITVYSVYPFFCMAMNTLDSHSLAASLTIIKLIDGAVLIFYAVNVLVTIIHIKERSFRKTCLLMAALTLISVAPLMVVNITGHRTYYTTYIYMVVFSVVIIRSALPDQLRDIIKKREIRKRIAMVAATCFTIITLLMTMFSIYNYDCYVIRSNDLAEKIANNESLAVPILPFDSISIEGSLNNILYFAFEDIEVDAVVISMESWDGYEQYRAQIVNNPIYAVKFALENWEYKDPLYPQKLCK